MTDNWEVNDRNHIAHLKQRISDLESGKCRFHCRTAKEAFIAGYRSGISDTNGVKSDWHVGRPEQAYKEWCDEQT